MCSTGIVHGKNWAVPGVGSTGGHMVIGGGETSHGGSEGATLGATVGGTGTTVRSGTTSGRILIGTTIGGVSRTSTGNLVRVGGTTHGGSTLIYGLGGTWYYFWYASIFEPKYFTFSIGFAFCSLAFTFFACVVGA